MAKKEKKNTFKKSTKPTNKHDIKVNVQRVEVKEVEEQDELFYAPKENKNRKKILNIIFWVVICLMFFVWIFDFIKIKNHDEPFFCIYEKTHEFDDGSVKECLGLGYKVYTYERESLEGMKYGPFFMKMEK